MLTLPMAPALVTPLRATVSDGPTVPDSPSVSTPVMDWLKVTSPTKPGEASPVSALSCVTPSTPTLTRRH